MASKFLEANPEKCHSCIFKSTHQGGLCLRPGRRLEIEKYLCSGKSHCCHNTGLACRGGRDLQLRVFYAAGLIPEPTDRALIAANDEYLESKHEE